MTAEILCGGRPLSIDVTLVLGGARSGKSRYAEKLVAASGLSPVYIATAAALDDELGERIAHHRDRRGAEWITIEEQFALAETIALEAGPERILLVDCLTLWLSNLTFSERDIPTEQARLVAQLAESAGPVILVSNEIGLGLVPETALGRRFRDAQGRLNQGVAEVASRVVFIAAGLPLVLKG
jgi:adenosylcobinamide kinase / adenosylcobinamide-phosphate guanylyltransferase